MSLQPPPAPATPPFPIQAPNVPMPTIVAPIMGNTGGIVPITPPSPESPPDERDNRVELGYSRFAPYTPLMASTVWNPDPLINSEHWDIFDAMKLMSVYAAPLNILKYGVLYLGTSFKAAVDSPKDPNYEKAQEIRDFVEYVYNNIGNDVTGSSQTLRSMIWGLSDCFHAGYQVTTLTWKVFKTGKYKGKWGLQSFTPRSSKEVGFLVDPFDLTVYGTQLFNIYNAQLNVSANAVNGNYIPVSLDRSIYATHNSQNGLPFGQGVARVAYKHTLYLSEAYRYWMIALERGGSPLLIGRTQVNNPDYVTTYRQALDNVRQGASLVLLPGDEAEAMQLMSPQVSTLFEQHASYHEKQITQIILGQTLTTQQGSSGSYGQYKAHENTQEFVFANAKQVLIDAIARFTRFIVQYNFGADAIDLMPTLYLGDLNIQMRQQLVSAALTYAGFGMWTEEDDAQLRKQIGMPSLSEEFVPNVGNKTDTSGSAVSGASEK